MSKISVQGLKTDQINVTFLGTGTSQGVPVITCTCDVCTSVDVKDKRLRSSVLIEVNGKNIVIDTSPDFRYQMLKNNIRHLDAVLLTHEHNDHTIGLDDIRPFNFRQQYDMPVYGLERVLDDVKSRFSYIFEENPYPGTPKVICHILQPNTDFEILEGVRFTTIGVMQGNLSVLGFRFGDFAYITDASAISDESRILLNGVRVLVVNALQMKPHYSHFTLDQAVEFSKSVKPGKTYLTHVSHNLGKYRDLVKRLPEGIFPAFDGLKISL